MITDPDSYETREKNSLNMKAPQLARIFSDHMVLQCEQPITIWGSSVPGDRLTIHLGATTLSTTATSDGKFSVLLSAQPPGGPFELIVEGSGGRLVIRDVLLGEVWLCIGQSNMVFAVKECSGAEQLIAGANHPQIRLHPLPGTERIPATSTGLWHLCTSQSVADFSAVAYLCAQELHKRLKRPIGVVLGAWSGTHCELWMSREDLLAGEVSRRDLLTYEACLAGDCSGLTPPAPVSNPCRQWAAPDFDDAEWPLMPVPGLWQDEAYFHHGVLWFRRQIEIPEAWEGRDLELGLGQCSDEDETYFNGERVGTTAPDKSGEPASNRQYMIAGKLTRSGCNTLAVRVSSYRQGGGLLGPSGAMSVRPVGTEEPEAISLAGAWRYQIETQTPMRNVVVHGWLTPKHKMPHELYDQMIAPLIPFTIRGVFWYQGEQNCWQAYDYRRLFPQLIRAWRSHWGEGNFPFIYVQTPNAKERFPMPRESEWAELREAQSMTLSESATALAVTIDCGEVDLHPKEKRKVSSRLAAAALATVYGQPIPYRSPHYSGHKCNGNSIIVEFKLESGASLKTNDGGPIRGFAIAGDDHRFVWAFAVIEGSRVVVWSPLVPHPVAIRYAWANNPDCNLYDSSNLPAEPFRTDSWPGLTCTDEPDTFFPLSSQV